MESAELDSIFGSAPVGIAQCTTQGMILAVNSVLQRMCGLSDRALENRPFTDLLALEQHEACEELMRELSLDERDSFQIDSKASVGMRWIRWTGWRIPQINLHGGAALIILAEDRTEWHETQDRLRNAERLETVGRLAGGIAHDFNNLLTGVLLYCDLLASSLGKGDPLRKYAEEIRGAGMQATGLVRQLLSVARPQTAAVQPMSLNEVAEGMRNLLAKLIGENIELDLQLDSHLGLVRMDPTQAQQILLNLALNARDAMPHGGRITISTSNCKIQVLETHLCGGRELGVPCAMTVVSDTGTGMDASTREHLFEAFFTTKALGKGTGLGLATVHDIVSRQGGIIHVESEPGQGTRVTVLLPLIPETVLPPEIKGS